MKNFGSKGITVLTFLAMTTAAFADTAARAKEGQASSPAKVAGGKSKGDVATGLEACRVERATTTRRCNRCDDDCDGRDDNRDGRSCDND